MIIGVIVGVISSVVTTTITMKFYLKRQKKEEIELQGVEDMKVEDAKKLEGYLRDHSFDLVKDVLSKWFESKKSLHFEVQNLHIVTETPLAKVFYGQPKNKIIQSIEFYNIKVLTPDVCAQAVSHLRAEEYKIKEKQVMDFWLECETLSEKYLEKNLKVLESIEKKVKMTNIPQRFHEWDRKGITRPLTCYILDNTVYCIYQEAKQYINSGKLNIFEKDITEEPGNIWVLGLRNLCAKTPDEVLANEFKETVCGIATDKTLTDELKALGTEKKFVDDKIGEFRQELNKIIYNLEKRHYILKCTCGCCKGWVDDLKKLDESYYKKLISPD